jgi:predicted PurR-regulated permease PerM
LYLEDFFREIPQLYNNVLVPWLSDASDQSRRACFANRSDARRTSSDLFTTNTRILRKSDHLDLRWQRFLYYWLRHQKSRLFLVGFLLTVISSFFIAMDYQLIVNFLLDQISPSKRSLLIEAQLFLVSTLHKYAKSYLMIMSITFVELTIGFSILGIESAIVVAFLIAIFDILPVAGTGGVMIPWTIFTFLEGDTRLGLGLLVVYLGCDRDSQYH